MESNVSVELRNVVKSYGKGPKILDGVNLEIGRSERICLLGPSGSGKTTILNLMAGFIFPDSGEILLGGIDQSAVPTNKRNIGMVFQQHALFPHMTVGGNIEFGLRTRRIDTSQRRERVRSALKMVDLEFAEKRFPNELSGGQRQRVAFARALVVRPEVMLLDEPFASLDTALRKGLRTELIALQEETEVPSVLVTHDQQEALSFGHRVAVIQSGKIAQLGTPIEVYNNPVSKYVANFIGQASYVYGKVADVNGKEVFVDVGSPGCIKGRGSRLSCLNHGDDVSVLIRPESAKLTALADNNISTGDLEGRVCQVEYYGGVYEYQIAVGNSRLALRRNDSPEARLNVNDLVSIGTGDFAPVVFPSASQEPDQSVVDNSNAMVSPEG